MSKINKGTPWPLGSNITTRGVNFSIAAPQARYIELLIFKNATDSNPKEIITLGEVHRSGNYWHVEVEGLGAGCFYGYRVINSENESKDCYNSKKILLDPCARAIAGWELYKRKSYLKQTISSANSLRAVVSERDKFDFYNHPRPKHPWNKTIIYELHVGGFTKLSSGKINNENVGTFLSLINKIPYLKQLGITTIELLPIFSFDYSDAPLGQENFWGYSPINWFTPHHQYIVSKNPLKAREEFKQFVATCHDNDLEVILDVVYNHTTEGNQNGPLISWKGFADSLYYYQDKNGNYLDVTGCGNTISANQPIVRKLILESIKCWSNELGVDGFRFDLGIALSRGKDLSPLTSPPLFEELENDPELSDLKLISEPWDCGGLYKLSNFPAKEICTWNGSFRDDVRRFWKADKDTTWNLKDRLIGSPELYKDQENSSKKSINFITSHDGFTLNDLVSFNVKHNLSNGENNRDGENNNNSWNHGIEGPTTNKNIEFIRNKQKRNFLSTLLLSNGIPMILMGDEVSRSQGGNNNSWCQNNPLGWMVWEDNDIDKDLKEFVKKLIRIRTQLSDFFSPKANHQPQKRSVISKNNIWIQWHGVKVNTPDWGSWSHTISYSIHNSKEGAVIWIGMNAYNQTMLFELPESHSPWLKVLDTTFMNANELKTRQLKNQSEIEVESQSLVLLTTKHYANKI